MRKPKAAALSAVWDRPDQSVLMPKQVSIRLPALVAAKLAALGEMYPRVTRTELINDLLATALEDFEQGLDFEGVGPEQGDPETGETFYLDIRGPLADFRALYRKHVALIEKELGIQLTGSKAAADERK